MDFSPEELDVSPPCFLVDNSQVEESQQVCRSECDQHLAILKRLPVFAASTRETSICSTNESLRRHPVARSCPTGSGGGGQGESGDLRGEQSDGQGQRGGDGSRDRRADGGAGGNSAGAGGSGGGNGGGGDGGGGDGDGGDHDDHDDGEDYDDHEDESPPAEEPLSSSSSDKIPSLIRPEAVTTGTCSNQWKGQKISASEPHGQKAAERRTGQQGSIEVSSHESSGDNYSQASTGIVGEGADVATDMPAMSGLGSLSEESAAQMESQSEKVREKMSTSSSSTGHTSKSEAGSTASSSSYHGDLSSLSSGGNQGPSPEVRKHLPLLSMLRTQSTSDTSSSSAGSTCKDGRIRGMLSGKKIHVMSVEEEDEPEVCSSQDDMFAPREVDKEQGHAKSDLSSDSSHILPPQHHSTPSDGQSSKGYHGHTHEKSLYQQALMGNQRTSTPVEGREFLPTPPSQGTPIDNVSTFQSLQFSGEASAKNTSSSSSEKVSLSSEEHNSIPVLIPSSPTAVDDKSTEDNASTRKEQKSNRDNGAEAGHEERKEQSEMARAAAELVESFDLSQDKQPQKTKSHLKHQEMSADDEITLPHWQQVQNVPQHGNASTAKKSSSSSSSNSSSLEKPSSNNAVESDSQLPGIQQWQSVISATASTSSSFQGHKLESTDNVPSSKKEQHMPNVDMNFLESSKDAPLISKAAWPKETSQGDQSLSPSSFVINPFDECNTTTKADAGKGPLVAPGPTQPEMSEDLFHPSITLERTRPQADVSDHPVDEPKEDDVIADDSQEIVFSLHLTQSQSDMDSQAPFPASLPREENQQQEVTVTEMTIVDTEDKSAETNENEQTPSLTKQDSSSQSILAPLVRPQRVQILLLTKDTHTVENQKEAETLASACLPLAHEEGKGDKPVGVINEIDPPLSTGDVAITDDAAEVPPLTKKDAIEISRPELCTPEKPVPAARKPINPRIPATIFSEPSSDSGLSGGFHFSLPKEPLRPEVSTTPPPIRPARHDTPDSQERASRRTMIPDALPVVSETPGMSSQAPPSSLDQVRPQSLTISMPRHGSPLSDSENLEEVFRFHTTLPPVSTSAGSSSYVQTNFPEQQRSIFSRAREAIAKGKKREEVVCSDYDPFAFTAEDEDPEPLRKRARRASPRGDGDNEVAWWGEQGQARDIPIEEAVEESSKEQDKSTERDNLLENVRTKRGHPEGSSESAESEKSEEPQSKRAKRGDELLLENLSKKDSSEAVHYRQITHTRIVTTVTTQVRRMVTVSIIDKGSGDVVEILTYEEDDRPKVQSEEKENEEVHEFVESSSADGSYVKVTSKSPKRQDQKPQRRSSPRMKNGESPAATKARSKPLTRAPDKTQRAVAVSEKSARGESRENVGLPGTDEVVSEVPAVTRQATIPVTEEEPPLQRTSSSDSSLSPGTRVLAKWLDNYFYPGVVSAKQYKNGRYLVTFDDGDKRRIPRENIVRKDLLPAGQSVMAQGDKEDDFYEEGVIVGYYRDGEERGYEIQIQSGAISRFPRSRVILSQHQAAAILSSESSLNVTSGSSVSIGAHSLRLRKDGNAASSDASAHNVSKSESVAGKDISLDTSSKDTSGSSSEDVTRVKKPLPRASPKGKVPKETSVTPKSTHKSSTHKAKAQLRRAGQRIGVESETSSDEQTVQAGKRRKVKRGLSAAYSLKSPLKPSNDEPLGPVTRSSPLKQVGRNEDDEGETVMGPLPANRNVFAGLAFLVTGVVRDRTELDESDSESERIEFNRDIIKRQIEGGGGVVLSSFPQSQISGAESFLVSDRHQRTQKYFQSLASGIPCVSHMWINDCCTSNKRLDYKRYLLPAGESLEAEGEIVECRPRRNILGNMRVFLHGSQQFKDTWSSVVLAAGCNMVTKIPNRFDYCCDVIICEDSKLPASVKHAAITLGIPIVSLEWLLQSLINGRQVAFDGHPKYDYRYKSA